jgi:hypothetical protein
MWEFRDLIFAAGVSEADFDKALEGRFIPFGALGDEVNDFTSQQNNQLYFDDEHDAQRTKMRKKPGPHAVLATSGKAPRPSW